MFIRNHSKHSNPLKAVLFFTILIFSIFTPVRSESITEEMPLVMEEKPFFHNISFGVGGTRGVLGLPSIRPIQRSYQDAFVSDGEFVPEYYNIAPILPKTTFMPTQSYQLNIAAETTIWDLFFLGIGFGYKSWRNPKQADEIIRERNSIQYFVFRDLSALNQARVSALTVDSFSVLQDAYWLNLNLRFPITLNNPYWEPFVNLEMGVGSCVKGESCNMARYSAGLGLEFLYGMESIRPFILVHTESIHQERPRLAFTWMESGISFGIRFLLTK